MSNLRVISDNAIDRASLTASSTQGAFGVANLQLMRKSDVWRSTGTTARLSATWPTPETIQGVALPFCNLSPTATMRVRATNEAQATNLLSAPADFSNGAWAKTGMSVSAGITGPDGTASAYTLTASAGNGTVTQNVTVAAGNYTSSFYARRRTGSGNVSIQNADGSWGAVVLTAGWVRISNDGGVTGATASVALKISNSGDAIDIAFAQLEPGAIATSYYPGARPLGYIDTWQGYTYDSGPLLGCPAPAVRLRGFSAVQSASAYAFGGGATARVWLPASVSAYGLAVDIVDTNNLQGYIEAAYLAAGAYWEAAINANYGASVTAVDSSKNGRTDAGDLVSDTGTMSKRMSLSLSAMPPADRDALWAILRSGGTRYPLFVSVFPEHPDLELERKFQVYGKFVQLPAMALPRFNTASATIEVESV